MSEVTKAERRTYADQGTEIVLHPGDIVAAEVLRTGRPLGFENLAGVDEFQQFRDRLQSAVPEDLPDVRIGIRGSSIHGNQFDRRTGVHDGPAFDTGRRSDRDLFIISPELARRAEELGIMRPGQAKRQLTNDDLRALGLDKLFSLVREAKDRKVTFRLFASEDVLMRETSYMIFTRGK